jgi:hypothetical protein
MPTKSTALVPAKPRDFNTHFRRLIQKTMGATNESIAKAEGVSIVQIEKSIRIAEIYREQNSLDAANVAVGNIAVELASDVKSAIRTGLRATKVSKRFRRKNGELQEYSVTTPDHDIQLKAVDHYKGLIEAIQPKGTKVNVNASANAAASASAFSESSYQPGVEEAIDRIRSKVEQANVGPRELATIKDDDADIIEGEVVDGESADEEEGSSSGERDDSGESAELSP